MISVIINADDLGNSKEINAQIREAIENGSITSSTIMANSKYLDEVRDIVNVNNARASFGVHLNLTEGESFTKSSIFLKRGIIDKEGRFIQGNSKRCAYPDAELGEAIFKEWDAQVSKLKEEGFKLSHADGHHHCHSWPGLESIYLRVLLKHGINRSRNCYLYPYAGMLNCIVNAFSTILYSCGIYKLVSEYPVLSTIGARLHYIHFNKILRCKGIVMPNYFGSYESFCFLQQTNRLQSPRNKQQIYEMMCHPGIPDFDKELQMIKTDAFGFLKSTYYKLTTYNKI